MKKTFFIKRLSLLLIPLLFPILILGFISVFMTQQYLNLEINKNNLNLLVQTKKNVELVLNELDSLMLNFDSNPNMVVKLKKILKDPNLTLEDINSLDIIKNFLDSTANAKPYVHSIYIYFANDHNQFISTNDFLSKLNFSNDISWYGSFLKHRYDNKKMWTESRQIKTNFFDTITVLTMYRKLYSPGIERGNGVIVLNISPNYMENLLNNLSIHSDQSILILNENNHIIFKNNELDHLRDIDIDIINNSKNTSFILNTSNNSYIVSHLISERYGWKYVSIIPRRTLYEIPLMLEKVIFYLIVCSLILSVLITYFITKKNYKYLQNIFLIFDAAENGLPLPPLPSRVKDEYGYIMQNIIKTFVQHNYLKMQLSERKYKIQAMELSALQSQMNPHFLFNTLQTIYWKVCGLTGNLNEANTMIENLSDILRYSLESNDINVTLEEEIKNTKCYIKIQKIRYKDKFDVIWEYDESITQLKIVKLILQPLIENSIYHGIKEKEGKSCIKIKILHIRNCIKLAVIDNGLGITPSKLEEIRKKLNTDEEHFDHIGLFNTNKRLKLTYGEPFGVKVRSKFGLGTAIYIYIPALE